MKAFISILKRREGDTVFFIYIIVFVILTLSAIIIEYYRLETLYQKVEYELQRGVNMAVEYAIMDDYRRDEDLKMDTRIAEKALYEYLSSSMKLDRNLNLNKDGNSLYQLRIRNLSTAESPPGMKLEGTIRTHSIFNFLTGEIRLPFKISSTNTRVD